MQMIPNIQAICMFNCEQAKRVLNSLLFSYKVKNNIFLLLLGKNNTKNSSHLEICPELHVAYNEPDRRNTCI